MGCTELMIDKTMPHIHNQFGGSDYSQSAVDKGSALSNLLQSYDSDYAVFLDQFKDGQSSFELSNGEERSMRLTVYNHSVRADYLDKDGICFQEQYATLDLALNAAFELQYKTLIASF